MYKAIYEHYESCYEKHGDCAKGVDWPNEEDAQVRQDIMLSILEDWPGDKEVSLLDFGAGCGHLKQRIDSRSANNIRYSALDISKKYCDILEQKYPGIDVYHMDILARTDIDALPMFDFIVLNGVFTEKRSLTDEHMWDFFTAVVKKLFRKARHGIAFNLMSPIVDWKDDNLFYVSYDRLGRFLSDNLSRHYTINQAYGLWEYTAHVFKEPRK